MEKIAITGTSGMLGRALLKALSGSAHITAISRSEKGQLPLRATYPGVQFRLGDVRDKLFLQRVLKGQDTVIHAAALKHVDLSEREPTEYCSVNVGGSLTVARVAKALGISRVVGISTDKACAPLNVYGLSKLLMERIFREHGYVSVRYGNVLGSDGSVLTKWTKELAGTGKITVTDPEMTRFFFPIEEAVDAVLWTLRWAPDASVVVPRLKATTLHDLAAAFLQVHGGGTIHVAGPRQGEKRHEALFTEAEGQAAMEPLGGWVILTEKVHGTHIPALTSDTAQRFTREELVACLS